MPNPKTGTVTVDVSTVVKELKAGKLDFRIDKANDIHLPVAKMSFDAEKIVENIESVVAAVIKAKPAVAKGQFIRKMTLASTMSCGINLVV
jgi:large subunit ribosomal protein L1